MKTRLRTEPRSARFGLNCVALARQLRLEDRPIHIDSGWFGGCVVKTKTRITVVPFVSYVSCGDYGIPNSVKCLSLVGSVIDADFLGNTSARSFLQFRGSWLLV